jgi:hypothetical protein
MLESIAEHGRDVVRCGSWRWQGVVGLMMMVPQNE